MDKSGSRPVLRRKHSKLPVHLRLEERYEVATFIMNHTEMSLKGVARHFNISVSYTSNIRDEFLEKVWVWKPGVLVTLLEAQGELFATARYRGPRVRK